MCKCHEPAVSLLFSYKMKFICIEYKWLLEYPVYKSFSQSLSKPGILYLNQTQISAVTSVCTSSLAHIVTSAQMFLSPSICLKLPAYTIADLWLPGPMPRCSTLTLTLPPLKTQLAIIKECLLHVCLYRAPVSVQTNTWYIWPETIFRYYGISHRHCASWQPSPLHI